MGTHLTLTHVASLAGLMALGASLPGVSALAVSARTVTHGLTHGALVSAGIVAGDGIFIIIALYGLSILADLLGNHFVLIRYAGAIYVIALGVMLLRNAPTPMNPGQGGARPRMSSFMTGFLITLADHKAMFFYLGFFPAFLDLSVLSSADTAIILLIAVLAVGGPKLMYALFAERLGRRLGDGGVARYIHRIAGAVMVAAGVLLLGFVARAG